MESVKVNGGNTVARSTYDNLVKAYVKKDAKLAETARLKLIAEGKQRMAEARVELLQAQLDELRNTEDANPFNEAAEVAGQLEQALLNKTEMTPCAIEDVVTQLLVKNL